MAVAQMNTVYYMELQKLPEVFDFQIIPVIKKIWITECCQERTAIAFQMKCQIMAAQALTKQCTW